jgi:hypothetical protein
MGRHFVTHPLVPAASTNAFATGYGGPMPKAENVTSSAVENRPRKAIYQTVCGFTVGEISARTLPVDASEWRECRSVSLFEAPALITVSFAD